jgi:hypothetical protein
MEDDRWMTYDDVAHMRGTSRDAAIRWVQRRKLRRQPGNDGRIRVLVPPDTTASPNVTPSAPMTQAVLEHWFATIEMLLRDRMADMSRQLEEARAEASTLREADAARRAKGRLARLLAAWKGS